MKISNASDFPLAPGTLPNMGETISGWFQPLSFSQVTKTIVNGEVVETSETISFQGVRQPMSAQQLLMKPEGERNWRWETIHALPGCPLKPDDVITYQDLTYRVISREIYPEYGYIKYDICQDYTP